MRINYASPPVPEGPKARIVSVFDESYVPESVFLYDCDAENVIDAICKCQIELSPSAPLLIKAQTGTGKTYAVLHELLPMVAEKGGRMLIVSNRLSIATQQKRELLDLLDNSRRGDFTDTGIQNEQDFGPAKIMTLQALTPFLRTPEGQEYCKTVSFFVVDEAHFFTSDILFNHDAGWLLQQIPKVFKRAIRVYLTATPEDVLVPLAEAEEDAIPPLEERLGLVDPYGTRRHLRYLRIKGRGYGHVSLRYFKSVEQLISQINNTPDDEKWFIFVSSKAMGQSIKERLEENEVTVTFLSSDEKGSAEWNSLIKDQKSSSRVLIATAVLDCGVNLRDDDLKHMAILTEDKTSFLQALGRKRCSSEEEFTLYVPALSRKRLSGLIRENDHLLSLAKTIECGDNPAKHLAQLWRYGTTAEKCLVYTPFGGKLRLNNVAVFRIKNQHHYYARLQELIIEYGDSAFPRLVHQWLGQGNRYNELNWLGIDTKMALQEQLDALLAQYLDQELCSDEQQAVFSHLLVDLHAAFGLKPKRTDRSPFLKRTALNNCLEEMSLPYHLDVLQDGAWILRKVDSSLSTDIERKESTDETTE